MKDKPLLVSVAKPLQQFTLNNSMGQSASDDESSSFGQEIIHHLGNAMNHYIAHKILRWTLALDICFQSIPDTLICLIFILKWRCYSHLGLANVIFTSPTKSYNLSSPFRVLHALPILPRFYRCNDIC
jgi:hypothetical protein